LELLLWPNGVVLLVSSSVGYRFMIEC